MGNDMLQGGEKTRLRILRERKGSLTAVALLSDLTPSKLSRAERDLTSLRIDEFIGLAHVLGLDSLADQLSALVGDRGHGRSA